MESSEDRDPWDDPAEPVEWEEIPLAEPLALLRPVVRGEIVRFDSLAAGERFRLWIWDEDADIVVKQRAYAGIVLEKDGRGGSAVEHWWHEAVGKWRGVEGDSLVTVFRS